MDIYVGNLPYKTTDEDLRTAFSQYGEVAAARVVMDRISNRSKGFGFVEMPDAEAAKKAIEAMDGHDFGGRNIRVNESKPRPQGERRSFRPRAPRADGEAPKDRW